MLDWLKIALFGLCLYFASTMPMNIVQNAHFSLTYYNPNPVRHSELVSEERIWPWKSQSHSTEISSLQDFKRMERVPYHPGPKPIYLSIYRTEAPDYVRQTLTKLVPGWYKLQIDAIAFTKMKHPPSKLAYLEVILTSKYDTASVSFSLPLGLGMLTHAAMVRIRSNSHFNLQIQAGLTQDRTIVIGVTNVRLYDTKGRAIHTVSINLLGNEDFSFPLIPSTKDYLLVQKTTVVPWVIVEQGVLVRCSKYCPLFKTEQAYMFTEQSITTMLHQYFSPSSAGPFTVSFDFMRTGLSTTGRLSVFIKQTFITVLVCKYLDAGKVYHFQKTLTLLEEKSEIMFLANDFEVRMQGLIISSVSIVSVRMGKPKDVLDGNAGALKEDDGQNKHTIPQHNSAGNQDRGGQEKNGKKRRKSEGDSPDGGEQQQIRQSSRVTRET